ncbi:MAG: dual specificity protein phosphatase family protein, partial [Proteobacteria bacterium]|nr:dual specificity protein phosphatase family protein [Pseudomonadota bacterium]
YGDFETLKNMGITTVINSRTKPEMDELKFKEDYLLSKDNINYSMVSVGGDISYSPEKLAEFDKAIRKAEGGKILLHCRSGHRSSQLYAAWLVKYKNMNPNDALKIVTASGWWPMPMEALLGKKLVISIAH